MKLVLTQEETVAAAIAWIKSQNLLKQDAEYVGNIETYSKEFLTITELKQDVETKAKDAE